MAAAGLKRPDDVRVCLSAGAALFRDWAFPFRSRAKVEQALSLMLETEFPFDADTLSHRVCLTGNAAASAGSISFAFPPRGFLVKNAKVFAPSFIAVFPIARYPFEEDR